MIKIFSRHFSENLEEFLVAITILTIATQINSPNHNINTGFSMRYIKYFIDNINVGIGFDNIHTSHFKYVSSSIFFIFTRLIYSCMIHNFVPSDMLAGIIRHIVKNNQGNIWDSGNYTEVMISSKFFKLLEYCLVPYVLSHC